MYDSSAPTKLDQSVIVDQVYFYALDEVRPGVVLNPACDFAQDKASLVLLCALVDAWELIEVLLKTDWKRMHLADALGSEGQRSVLGDNKRKELGNRIKLVICQRFPRYHWLLPLPATDRPLVADFQTLSTLPLREVSQLPKRAVLLSPFREQLPTRFTSYMNRIGVPDTAESDITRWIDSGIDILFPRA